MGFVQHYPPPPSSSALNNMYPFILDQSPGCCVKIFIGYLYSFPMWDPLQKIILKRRLFHIDVNVERVPQPPLPLPSHTHTHTHTHTFLKKKLMIRTTSLQCCGITAARVLLVWKVGSAPCKKLANLISSYLWICTAQDLVMGGFNIQISWHKHGLRSPRRACIISTL